MFILPYLYKQSPKKSGLLLHSVSFFLDKGGTQLLFIEDGEIDLFLHENGIHVNRKLESQGVLFLEIDPSKTRLRDFYSFHEKGTQALEVWRTFVWVTDQKGEDVWNTIQQMKQLTPLSNKPVLQLLKSIQPMV